MAKRHYRKLRRLKREGEHSEIVIALKSALRKRTVRLVIGIVLVMAVFCAVYLINKYSKYDSYKVVNSIKIESGSDSRFVAFEDFVVKYSSDGISYIDGKETVWEEGYEMKTPMVDVCESYLAVADKNTNDIFLYNEDGRQGKVTASYPITKIEVAKQGVVAALLEDKNSNYIEVYDKEGKQLVSHKTLIDENGYPLNFSMSPDGTKLMVSYMTVKNGILSNKVMFYNFAAAGKNSSGKMVGEFAQYEETIVPTVKFVSDDDAIAIGEDVLSIYKMKDKPDLKEEIELKDEIQKVFYNEEYIGLVFKNSNSNEPYRIEVYNLSGTRVMKKNINMDFETVLFSGNNVLMYNDLNCQIISLKGVEKFNYTFKGQVNSIIPVDGSRIYLFMTNSAIEKVRLN